MKHIHSMTVCIIDFGVSRELDSLNFTTKPVLLELPSTPASDKENSASLDTATFGIGSTHHWMVCELLVCTCQWHGRAHTPDHCSHWHLGFQNDSPGGKIICTTIYCHSNTCSISDSGIHWALTFPSGKTWCCCCSFSHERQLTKTWNVFSN